MATYGRGRGRARTLLNKVGGDPHTTNALSNNAISLKNFTELEKSIELCLKNNSSGNMEELLKHAQRQLGTNDEQITKLVHSLTEKCVEDRDSASGLGEVASSLIGLSNFGVNFRTNLLKRVQHFYMERDEMKKKTFSRYLGFATLLCSLFKSMRVNEEPLKALVVPVYDLLEEMIEGQSSGGEEREAEVETFHNCLLMVANLLEVNDKNRMTHIFKKVRETIIKNGSPKMRCLLLELLEFHTIGNWNCNEVKVYYSDQLMGMY